MKEVNPLVTINILSYNRKDELRNTLQKVYAQNYKNIEVIVVDNNSLDGSAEMVQLEFPDVKLIRFKKNIGIAGWNEGFKIAKGEYVLVLDDDSYPEEEAIEEGIKCFRNNNKIGIVAFNVFNITAKNNIHRFPGGWLPNENIDNCKWNYFIGCAFLMRSSLYIENLFPPAYFICFQEMPIVRYLHQIGYSIFYDRRIKAYHKGKNQNKVTSYREYYHYRNLLNFVIWNVSFPFNLFYGIRIFVFFFFRSLRRGWFIKFLKALLFQTKCLHDYRLIKMTKDERRTFFQTQFVEYKISKKIVKFS